MSALATLPPRGIRDEIANDSPLGWGNVRSNACLNQTVHYPLGRIIFLAGDLRVPMQFPSKFDQLIGVTIN